MIALATMLTTGCESLRGIEAAGQPDPWVKTSGRHRVSDTESLLLYFEYVRKLPAAELVKEHEAARQAFTKSRSDFNRVRYAMILGVPGAPFTDDTRGMEVLEPLLKNPDAELRNVAFVVSLQIREQRRSQALQQKLDALKALDRSLLERGSVR